MDMDRDEPVAPRLGFAITCLVLGIIGIATSVVLVGALFGLFGLIFGIAHLFRRQRANAMAWIGIVLSIGGIAASVQLGRVYYQGFMTLVEAFQKGMTADTEEWKGVMAPDITVTSLDGQTIKLSDLRGKRVVLDFWATWCGPCVQEIPHFIQLRKDVPEDELVIIGISDESKETLQAFLLKTPVNYPLVSAPDLPAPYSHVNVFPTTFFIDRNGVIQDVVLGYHDLAALKSHATGPDYTGEVKTSPEEAKSSLKPSETPLKLEVAWSVEVPNGQALCHGDWNGDGIDDVLVATPDENLKVVDLDGKIIATLDLAGDFGGIAVGRHSSGARLLAYTEWEEQLVVFDSQGKKAWTFEAPDGINSACWCDVDGDGIDEVIIGLNGSKGVQALSADGKPLWQDANVGDSWHQAVVPARAAEDVRIYSTSSDAIHVFDGKGTRLPSLKPIIRKPDPDNADDEAEEMREVEQIGAARETIDGPIQILVSGHMLAAFPASGDVEWSALANGSLAAVSFGDVNGDGTIEWALVDVTGELVLVTPRGEKLAAIPNKSDASGYTIISRPSQPGRLLILQNGTVRAYKVAE
jgi:peroxiredoxin